MTPTTEQLKDLLLLYEQESVAGAFAVCDLSALAPTLAAEVVSFREALHAPKYEHLDAACYGMNCFPDELEFILEQYRQALDAISGK